MLKSPKKVEDNRPSSLEEFRKMGIVKDGIYKNLEEAIQNILDVCALLVREKDLGIPSEEQSFTDLLYKSSLIDGDTKSLIDSLRGMRNRLVHKYGKIEDEIVYRDISENLGDFGAVVDSLRELVKDKF